MKSHSANLVALVKLASPNQGILPGESAAAVQRQRRQQYATQTRASQMRHGAALRARQNAQAEAQRRQDAQVKATAYQRRLANGHVLYETQDRMRLNGYRINPYSTYKAEKPGMFWGYNPTDGGWQDQLQSKIIQGISDQKLRNGGVLPTEDQAYILADDTVNAYQQQYKTYADDDGFRYKDGEDTKMRHDSQDFIYNLYAKDPKTGRSLADGIVRNTTRTPGYTRTV